MAFEPNRFAAEQLITAYDLSPDHRRGETPLPGSLELLVQSADRMTA